MHLNAVCTHTSPVVVNPVEGGGWRGHCLRCGQLGPVGSDSAEALERLRRDQSAQYPGQYPGRRRPRSGSQPPPPGSAAGGS